MNRASFLAWLLVGVLLSVALTWCIILTVAYVDIPNYDRILRYIDRTIFVNPK